MSDNTVKKTIMPPTKPVMVVSSKKSLPPLPKIGSNRSLKLVSKSSEIISSNTNESSSCPYYNTNKHELVWQTVDDFNKGICICGYIITE
jgi:hypothetical protein